MGQATEKVKLRLASMGYGALPISFQLGEQSVLKDEASGRRLKKYTVLLNPGEVQAFLNHLQFRSMHPQHLIQVVYAEARKEESDYCKLFVYLEQICLSLQEIVSTHFLNMIKLLYSALHGFQALFGKHGYFTVESCMIGLNYENTPKSWLSRKYTAHSPKSSYSYQKGAKGEEAMVSELKEIFFCKVDRVTLPIGFNLAAATFQGLIKELRDKFGEELLDSKVDLTLRPVQEDKAILSSAKSSSALTSPPGTQIRFNYHRESTKNRSNINISFNHRPVLQPQSINRSERLSIEKPRVNFSYNKDSAAIVSICSSQEAPAKQLQNTNYESGPAPNGLY